MPDIFIDSLAIEDFGPYYGKHEFLLRPLDGRNTILIGGKNGAGKTHFLRALYLALAGKSGAGDLRKVEEGSGATKFDINESLNRRARQEGRNTCSLSLKLIQRDGTGGGVRALTLSREIKFLDSGAKFSSEKASLAGENGEITLEDKIEKLRDAFLPRHLARFFFFDAERGQDLQLSDKEIIDGTGRVLGLYSYQELVEDLRQLTQSGGKISKKYGESSEAERRLNEVLAKVTQGENDLKSLGDDLEEISQEITDHVSVLSEIEERLKLIGAVDPKELENLREKKDQLKSAKDKLESKLSNAWKACIPLVLMGSLRIELHEYLVQEEKRRDWESRKNSVEPRIPRVKKEVFAPPPREHELEETTRTFYENRLEQALKGMFHPPEEGMSDSIYVIPERNEVSVLVRNRLLNLSEVGGLRDSYSRLECLAVELREIEQKMKSMQGNGATQEEISQLRERRGKVSTQKIEAEEKQRDKEIKIKEIEKSLQEHRKEETKLTEQVLQIKKGRAISKLAHSYRDAAQHIREKAANQLRVKISEIVSELWLDITDRGLEFISVEFDNNWQCTLIRRDRSKVDWASVNTSAGQRQVRILAFTEALRRLARQVPPLVVDTPLARLDKEVKESVLERLYLTGHQSIILATNSEIEPSSQLFEKISGKLARVYTLNPIGDQTSQTYHVDVSSDYFKRVL